MEPYRPMVDREVLAFIRAQTFTPRDFAIDIKGVCRLHPELGRRIATHARVGGDLQAEVSALIQDSLLAVHLGGARPH